MLARYLRRQPIPIRYQVGHPLHTLAQIMLSDPDLEHLHLPDTLQSLAHDPVTQRVPAMHRDIETHGQHGLLPNLLQLLHGSGQFDPAGVDRVRQGHQTILDMLRAWKHPHQHPFLDALTPGTEGYDLSNQATLPYMPQRLGHWMLASLSKPDFDRLQPHLTEALATGDLHALLNLHRLGGQVLGMHGHGGPVGDLWALLRHPIFARLGASRRWGSLVANEHGVDWRPNETLPEDYYAG